jgi:hypothetical protein
VDTAGFGEGDLRAQRGRISGDREGHQDDIEDEGRRDPEGAERNPGLPHHRESQQQQQRVRRIREPVVEDLDAAQNVRRMLGLLRHAAYRCSLQTKSNCAQSFSTGEAKRVAELLVRADLERHRFDHLIFGHGIHLC